MDKLTLLARIRLKERWRFKFQLDSNNSIRNFDFKSTKATKTKKFELIFFHQKYTEKKLKNHFVSLFF